MAIIKKSGLGVRKGTGLDALRRAKEVSRRVREGSEALCLVLDVSGSMDDNVDGGYTYDYESRAASLTGTRKIDAAYRASKALIEKSVQSEVAVVDFSTTAATLHTLTRNRESCIEALRRLKTRGGTNISSGIHLGLERIARSDAAVRRLILMSDGADHRIYEDERNRAVNEAARQEVIIDCVAFGVDADRDTLESIAKRTRGVCKSADSADELVKVFKQLEAGARGLLTSGS